MADRKDSEPSSSRGKDEAARTESGQMRCILNHEDDHIPNNTFPADSPGPQEAVILLQETGENDQEVDKSNVQAEGVVLPIDHGSAYTSAARNVAGPHQEDGRKRIKLFGAHICPMPAGAGLVGAAGPVAVGQAQDGAQSSHRVVAGTGLHQGGPSDLNSNALVGVGSAHPAGAVQGQESRSSVVAGTEQHQGGASDLIKLFGTEIFPMAAGAGLVGPEGPVAVGQAQDGNGGALSSQRVVPGTGLDQGGPSGLNDNSLVSVGSAHPAGSFQSQESHSRVVAATGLLHQGGPSDINSNAFVSVGSAHHPGAVQGHESGLRVVAGTEEHQGGLSDLNNNAPDNVGLEHPPEAVQRQESPPRGIPWWEGYKHGRPRTEREEY